MTQRLNLYLLTLSFLHINFCKRPFIFIHCLKKIQVCAVMDYFFMWIMLMQKCRQNKQLFQIFWVNKNILFCTFAVRYFISGIIYFSFISLFYFLSQSKFGHSDCSRFDLQRVPELHTVSWVYWASAGLTRRLPLTSQPSVLGWRSMDSQLYNHRLDPSVTDHLDTSHQVGLGQSALFWGNSSFTGSVNTAARQSDTWPLPSDASILIDWDRLHLRDYLELTASGCFRQIFDISEQLSV